MQKSIVNGFELEQFVLSTTQYVLLSNSNSAIGHLKNFHYIIKKINSNT